MKLKTDADILRYAKSVSIEKNVRLSPTVCAFYVSLVRLFHKEAMFDSEKQMSYVQYSCREFANIMQFSFKMVCVSLQKLNECELIARVPVKRDFRPLEGGRFLKNKPHVTYLDMSLFEIIE